MPIEIVCPGCSSRLSVADAAAGKTARCPQCQGLMTVPALVEGSLVIAPPQPPAADRRRKSRPRYEDEDDRPRRRRYEDDEDDRPRRRRRSDGPPVGLIFGLLAGFLVLAVAGVAIYFVAKKKSDPAAAKGPSRPPLPRGWQDFTPPDGQYRVYVPGTPQQVPGGNAAPLGGLRVDSYAVLATPGQPLGCSLIVLSIPRSMSPADREEMKRIFMRDSDWLGLRELSHKDVTWAGGPAVEVQYELGAFGQPLPPGRGRPAGVPARPTARRRMSGDNLYLFAIQNVYGDPVSDADLRAFFDSFEILK
ncbi:MAG TPA: hypothetical protein VKE74_15780 [Gemmataceae bacterium]|nr:hypothetical protein [Gemmataceae bacterium]